MIDFSNVLEKVKDNYPGLNQRRLQQEFQLFQENFIFSGRYQTEGFLFDEFQEYLIKGIPLEYINNEAYFFESRFFVNENVLIPRSESEILIEKLLQKLSKKKNLEICEIGVGSLALGISLCLKLRTSVQFLGTDISEKALEVAQENLVRFTQRLKHVAFDLRKTDRLKGVDQKFDCIFSNPPYVKKSQRSKVHPQVDKNEPELALYLEDESYSQWNRELIAACAKSLKKGGFFILEGHEDNLGELELIAQNYFSQVTSFNDYSERKRFILLEFN